MVLKRKGSDNKMRISKNMALSVLCSLIIATTMIVSPAIAVDALVEESSIITVMVALVVGVVVATALLPTIFNQTAVLEADTAGDLDTDEEALIGVWNILIIVGVMIAIIGMVL